VIQVSSDLPVFPIRFISHSHVMMTMQYFDSSVSFFSLVSVGMLH
jgi:hypothetical protein